MEEARWPIVRISASRSLGLERGLPRLALGLVLMWGGLSVVSRLDFSPSAISNRITEYSVGVVMVPLVIAGLALAWSGAKWLVFALWPGWVGIVADEAALTFHLGPMGTRRYRLDRLDLRYHFEMDEDEDAPYESFLPEAEQVATLLPRMRYPGEREPLERRIRRFVRGDEQQLADILRPFIQHVRRDRPPIDG